MKKVFNFLFIRVFLFLFLFLLFSSTSFSREFKVIEDFNKEDVFIGSIIGSSSLKDIKTTLPKAYMQYFVNYDDAQDALKTMAIDAFIADENILKHIIADNRDVFKSFDYQFGDYHRYIGVNGNNKVLIKIVNEYIRQSSRDGTLKDMKKRWIVKNLKTMPHIKPSRNVVREINVFIDKSKAPFSFINSDGKLSGFDIELLTRFGVISNVKINFIPIDFRGADKNKICAEADLFVGVGNPTSFPCDNVIFSKPYYDFESSIMVLKNREVLSQEEKYAGEKIGVLTGTSFVSAVQKYLSKSKPVNFTSGYADEIMALKNGKIDGFLADKPAALDMIKQNPGLKIDENVVIRDKYALIFNLDSTSLRDEFSKEIVKMKESGEILQIQQRWLNREDGIKSMHPAPLPKEGKRVIAVGTDGNSPPFSFMYEGKLVGIEIDVVNRILDKLGYGATWHAYDYSGMISAIMAKKIDVFGSLVAITPERMESVLFAESDYSGNVSLVVRDDYSDVNENGGFLSGIKKSFERTFLRENRYKMIFKGIKVTSQISFFSILLGTILGVFVGICRRSKKRRLNIFGKIYIRLFQGIPILVTLMFFFYVVFADVKLDGITIAIIAFGLNFAAYASEMFRAGIDAVNIGQKEASYALGFGKYKTFYYVLMPQALRHIIPVYRGEAVSTVKMTSVVGYIAVEDLTKISDMIRASTYEAFFPLISTAIIYFILSYLLIFLLNFLERKINPLYRKRVIKGVNIDD